MHVVTSGVEENLKRPVTLIVSSQRETTCVLKIAAFLENLRASIFSF
jgi:hypothetical protein